MKRILGVVACLFVLIVLVNVPKAGAQSKLEGAWKLVEIKGEGPNAPTLSNPQPSLWIFTKKHFSLAIVMSDKPRPDVPQKNATDAQRVAAWGPFMAAAGSYEVNGNTLITYGIVNKIPSAAGTSTKGDLKIEGNTFSYVARTVNDSPVTNPPTVFKFERIE